MGYRIFFEFIGPSLSYIRAPGELRDVGICLLVFVCSVGFCSVTINVRPDASGSRGITVEWVGSRKLKIVEPRKVPGCKTQGEEFINQGIRIIGKISYSSKCSGTDIHLKEDILG